MTHRTRLIAIDPAAIDEDAILQAAKVLQRGGLVAFPTETVYGVGADALNAEAVQKIFVAKGRPLDNPIIVHVAGVEDLELIVDRVTPEQTALMDRFWPGPLTMIFRQSERLPSAVTAGRNTVAVRMPRNAVALALIRASERPIAAPSANLSGRPSPTSAEHVLQDLKGRIDLILDGGPVEVGLESTVLDTSRRPPVILRPGAVTREELEVMLGTVAVGGQGRLMARSPGTRHRHYSPRARLTLVAENDAGTTSRLVEQHLQASRRVGVIIHSSMPVKDNPMVTVRILPKELDKFARQLFAVMRELDQMGVDEMIIEKTDEKGIGAAVMDRLRRAAAH
jgi:L-threonylcarbamoyladenylate synthase